MLQVVKSIVKTPVPFTAADLIDGMSFMEPVYRRAVLFGLEQKMSVQEVTNITHARARLHELTPFSEEILKQQPRHIRLNYVFWAELSDGLITPLIDLEATVQASFGLMSWDDLTRAYAGMIWTDEQIDAEHFIMVARMEGAL